MNCIQKFCEYIRTIFHHENHQLKFKSCNCNNCGGDKVETGYFIALLSLQIKLLRKKHCWKFFFWSVYGHLIKLIL